MESERKKLIQCIHSTWLFGFATGGLLVILIMLVLGRIDPESPDCPEIGSPEGPEIVGNFDSTEFVDCITDSRTSRVSLALYRKVESCLPQTANN